MNSTGKLIAVLMASSLVTGCQSFPLAKLGFGKARPAPAMQRPEEGPEFSAAVLAEGREQLRQGKLSAAVASFRMAAADPSTRAEANNGLGVAYAKIGRADLADRYFRTAALLDPANIKFAANLARLQRAEMYAVRQIEAEAVAVAVATEFVAVPQPVTAAPPVEVALSDHVSIQPDPASRVTRVSRGEIRIASRTLNATAPTMRVEYRPSKVAAPPAPDTDEAPAATGKTQYPVRVALVQRSQTIRPAYPVRLDLTR